MNHDKAAAYAHGAGSFTALNALYDTVPTGDCKGCTKCCSESVNIGYLEFLNIYTHVPNLFENEAFVRKLIQYYLLELVKPMQCPFLSETGKCTIYQYRPLPCRLFGNASESAYQENYKAIRRQNLETAMHIKQRHGYLLPKAVVHKDIGFCSDYRVASFLDHEAIDMFYARRIHLDSQLFFAGVLDEGPRSRDLVSTMIDALFEWAKPQSFTREDLTRLRLDALQQING